MGVSQLSFSYSAAELEQLERLLSKERLTPYASHDLLTTIKKYEYNTFMAEKFYGILQGAEIVIRNAIHNNLSFDLSRSDWYSYIGWDIPESDALDRAQKHILERGKDLTPDTIISELTFGFWVQMTTTKYEKLLWVPHIYKAFPGITTDRKSLNKRLHRILALRNRIAHHERITHFNLCTEYTRIIETIHWTCPITAAWVDETNRLKKQLWPEKQGAKISS
jgi:hypothetical protein